MSGLSRLTTANFLENRCIDDIFSAALGLNDMESTLTEKCGFDEGVKNTSVG